MNKLLIIGNNETDNKMLKQLFNESFYIVFSTNPMECLSSVIEQRYDLVIIEDEMQGMSGIDFLRSVKPKNKMISTPIIIYSDKTDERLQSEAFSFGATDYYIKTCNRDNFRLRCIHAVKQYHELKLQRGYEMALKKGLQLLLSNNSEEEIMTRICKGMIESYGGKRCKMFFLENGFYVNRYEWATEEERFNKNETVAGISYQKVPTSAFVLAERTIQTNSVLFMPDIEELKEASPTAYKVLRSQGIKSCACAPIVAGEKFIGFISITDYDPSLRPISEITLGLCIGIGSYYERKRYQNLLEYDSLTGLYRKQAFQFHMREILDNNPLDNFLIIKMDISNFKIINTFYGFEEGNRVLKLLADSFHKDSKKALLVSRIENDDFLIFVRAISESEFLDHISYVERYLLYNSKIKKVKMNYGLYYIQNNHEDVESIYSKASFANNQCKISNKKYVAYKDESLSKVIEEQKIFDDFEDALANGEFQFYIQPKYDIQLQEYCGGEALCRWVKPNGTIIPPGLFIEVFEKTGLIKDLDRYLFICLMQDIRRWLDEGKRILPISINVSKYNFDSEVGVYTDIIDIMDSYRIPHELVQIEITETTYANNMALVQEFCNKMIKEQGIEILMDDFGTGDSSLNVLKDLDISIIKLDYKFLSKTKNIEKQKIIITAVVDLANKLKLPVVAEGVETKEEVEFFESLGVRYIQGFYFGKPMPKQKYIELINKKLNL